MLSISSIISSTKITNKDSSEKSSGAPIAESLGFSKSADWDGPLSRLEKFAIEVQRTLGWLALWLLGPVFVYAFHFTFKFHVKNMKDIRRRYRDLMASAKGPVILCSNHLTMIDSVLQTIILAPLRDYFLHYDRMPWNLPEAKNVEGRYAFRVITFLGKCFYIRRMADPKTSRKSVAKMNYVLARGDVLSIFPEGRRSRDGIIDDQNISYGVGQLLKDKSQATVICLYLRGKNHGRFGDFPQKNDELYVQIDAITLHSTLNGLRRVRDLSEQVIAKLKDMEKDFFNHASADRK